jgi:2-polyprenyl-3-methyl-5-hydroxy-6-metoxy-1,4-benzoquinol methylase
MDQPNPATPRHLAAGQSADETDLIIRRRYALVKRYVELGGDTLLDFGCGTGAQTQLFAEHFRRVLGVDITESSLVEAAPRVQAGATSAGLVCYDGASLPVRTGAVDLAISFEVLEHVRDEAAALEELARVLRPGGMLALSVPNKWWIFETHGAALPLLPWNRVPFFSWLPKPIHDRYARARIYRRGDIVGLLSKHGFDVQASTYITAPMDVVRNERVRRTLRRLIFRHDDTRVPFLATAILVIARRP